MPEEERWCGDAVELDLFFLEIDLTLGHITEIVAGKSGVFQIEIIMWPLETHEFDTPGVQQCVPLGKSWRTSDRTRITV